MATEHQFHIPVMGTGYTIDAPLKVAHFGISSVISLVDDILIEQMRKFYCDKLEKPYTPITNKDKDARAHRITAYLNLINELVNEKTEQVRNSPFEPGSEITKYYEMLTEITIKQLYTKMLLENDPTQKLKMQDELRKNIKAGSIDVNIMTKLDRDRFFEGEKLTQEFSDALSALRGFAKSSLQNASLVLSAGFNASLYNYIPQFKDFFPDQEGNIKKKITLKVSDYRSAVIQGKYLAKRGIWVSEYRIESALNCGGHAFVNDGHLMGPILEEFKSKKQELIESLHEIYKKTLAFDIEKPLEVKITAQGGIGTNSEHNFLLHYYNLDRTGWCTPFMLVPEVVNIDEKHLQKLLNATEEDLYLSDSSPLNIPFWNLRSSESEESRRELIQLGTPGSLCPKQYAMNNGRFMESDLCPGSRAYQIKKLKELTAQNLPQKLFDALKESVLNKSCICHDLAGSVTKKLKIDLKATTAVCAGPNIINFSKIATLEEMVNHIYGRISLITNLKRPHMFIKELMLNIEHLKKETKKSFMGMLTRPQKKLKEVKENLLSGIEYYQNLAKHLFKEQQESFVENLKLLRDELESISFENVETKNC